MALSMNITFLLRIAVLANILVTLVAVIHIYILVLEMFLWETPAGRKAFKLSVDFARETRVLAANQGLYNGFLAAGLLWGLWLGDSGVPVTLFFLSCVLIAGIFGAVTASRKILYVQALPALVALVAVMLR
jgi:putative membrane protein